MADFDAPVRHVSQLMANVEREREREREGGGGVRRGTGECDGL